MTDDENEGGCDDGSQESIPTKQLQAAKTDSVYAKIDSVLKNAKTTSTLDQGDSGDDSSN